MPASIRRTRTLNEDTVSRLTKYLVGNPQSYVLPPLFISMDGENRFEPVQADSELGHLHISMAARLIVNGGEHERAAIERALAKQPNLNDEKITVIFQPDRTLHRAAEIYAELKMFATRPSASLRLLHSTEDDLARLSRELAEKSIPFKGFVELKRSSLSIRSRMLFTLSAVHQATKALLAGIECKTFDERLKLSIRFWNAVDKQFPEWRHVRTGKMLPSDVRFGFLHSHGLVLQALGRVGNALMRAFPNDWEAKLEVLRAMDWQRENVALWEGRALIGGRVSKSMANVTLTGNVIKKAMGLPLLPVEKEVERAHNSGRARR